MKNTTRASERANKIAAAKKQLKKWSVKDSDLGRKFTAKYTSIIEEVNNEEKEGLFIVVGDTFKVKDELKEAGFKYCGGSRVWYSDKMIEITIDGIELIEG